WTRGEATGARALLRLSAAGDVLWRQATPGAWTTGRSQLADLVAHGDRVCLLDAQKRANDMKTHVVECRRIDDGAVVWSRDLASEAAFDAETPSRLYLDGDGVSAWFETATGNVDFARIGADGTPRASKTWNRARLPRTHFPNVARVALIAGEELIVTDAAGTERARRPRDGLDVFSRFTFAADGSFVAAVRQTGAKLVVSSRDASGAVKWTRTLDSASFIADTPVVTGDAVYVAYCCTGGTGRYVRRIARLSLADGSTVWERSNTTPYFAKQRLMPASGRDGVVAVAPTGRAVAFDLVDGANGDVVASRREACAGFECSYAEPLPSSDGNAHAFAFAGLAGSTLVRWPLPAADARGIRLDQPGIAGSWWSPYANGEGFVLDYLPDSRTLFMPWFTFSRDGGNDPAGQRWYVVQGSVPQNATSVDLPITETTGGAFDAGPAVQPTIVGTATLTFTDCDNGTLRYRFDEGRNGGASGTITLSRLLPGSTPCTRADGTIEPRGIAPANGFDARMSGSWFEPATAGQGLQFAVQPGGIFFAPWFAFDPAGSADDPGAQRWFTIQGSLADARNGVVTLPIVQTLGGAFDSAPTNNMTIVGSATVTMQACDRAKLDYRFDDNELAATMRNRSGSIDLVKAGGCAP
ncbi:MAG TPA: hypothetical protein VJ724_08695, partial [Tahibacter sp.]|nr:hypothetical protein [Tahibacter sp.]